MLKWCALFMLAIFSQLSAEMIGKVEYQFPESAKDWKQADELKNEESQTFIYIPANQKKEETKEYFTAHTNNLPVGDLPRDEQVIVGMLQPQFPEERVHAKILKANPNAVTYEWWAEKAGKEQTHGWFRFIKTEKGLVLLGYQTQNVDAIEKARKDWLPQIDNAKEVK